MADLRVKAAIDSVQRAVGDGEWMDARGTRDGAMIKAGWLQGLAMEGRVFGVNTGDGTTVDTFTAAYSAAKPDLNVAVPTGVTIVPMMIEVWFEDTGTVDEVDVVAIATAAEVVGAGGTAEVVYNLRTDAPRKSRCTAHSVVASGGTTPIVAAGNYVEFFRGPGGLQEDFTTSSTAPTNELISRSVWNVGEALVPPVIVGPGTLCVYASAQAGTGGITAIWAEIPSNDID